MVPAQFIRLDSNVSQKFPDSSWVLIFITISTVVALRHILHGLRDTYYLAISTYSMGSKISYPYSIPNLHSFHDVHEPNVCKISNKSNYRIRYWPERR